MSLNHLKNINDQIAPYLNIGCNDLKVNGTAEIENLAVDALNVTSLNVNGVTNLNGQLTVTGTSNLNGNINTANNITAIGVLQSAAVFTDSVVTQGLQLTGNAIITGTCNINGSLRIFNKNPFQVYYPMSYPQALTGADYLNPRGAFYYGGTDTMLPIVKIIMCLNNALDCTAFVQIVNQSGQVPPYTPTGSNTICSQSTGTSTNQYTSVDLGTISNLPTGPCNITVNCYRTSGTQLTQLYGIMVFFG